MSLVVKIGARKIGHKGVNRMLLHQSDLKYLGAFRVPHSRDPVLTFSYGGAAPSCKEGKSLYLVGHNHYQQVAEITIPEPLQSTKVTDLPIAEFVQPFGDITGGLKGQIDHAILGGTLAYGDRLLWTVYAYYDANNVVKVSHGVSSLNISKPEARGIFSLQSGTPAGAAAGYMAYVPDPWRKKLGYPVICGQAGIAIIGRTSSGPAAMGFDPARLGAAPAPAEAFLYYPLPHPLPSWRWTDSLAGAFFVRDTVGFVGVQGIGPHWYGPPEQGDLVDPCRRGQGPHAPPYVPTVWLYDAHDFLVVKERKRQPWELLPYENFELTGNPFFGPPCAEIGGVTFDPVSRRLYLTQFYPDHEGFDRYPLVHVYEIG